jgi:hypothetical protein
MLAPYLGRLTNRWWSGLRLTLLHICITLLAIGIAFSLPIGARYILYQWWPKVAEDANLLIATEASLAAALALLFNMAGIAWENRSKVRMADLASLVHVRQSDSWIARWRERRLVRLLPAARDSFVLTITGFDTFADAKSLLRGPLNKAYEIRVMLLNPYGNGAGKHVDSLPDQVTLQNFIREVESSIAHLAMLRTSGKKVSLKFYEHEPFWKIVVLGDHVWVQYCHSGCEVKREPEYIFALNREHPRQGLFVPFYMHFLEQWSDFRHPEYDFDTGQLIYRDVDGNEIKRVAFDGFCERASAAPSSSRPGAIAPSVEHEDFREHEPAVEY